MASPSEKFFFSKKPARTPREIASAMKQRGTLCLAVKFPAPDAVPDVLWPQLKKTAQALVRGLEAQDFSVFGYYHWSDGRECVVLLELDRWELPAVEKALGPSIGFARDVESFVKTHRHALNLHIEHGRMVAVEKRKARDAKAALLSACRRPDGLGVPGKMARQLARCKVYEGGEIATAKWAEFLSDYFFAKIA
jgi:tRNA nucleotidyltransferase (CCA-adding enzyme)